MHLGFVPEPHLYTCTHKHKSPTTFCRVFLLSGANWRQRIWKPGAKRPLRREENLRELFPSPRSFPRTLKGKKIIKAAQNVPWKCALWAAATYWHRGRARGGRTSPRLLGQVFPSFSWHPGSEFSLVSEFSVKPWTYLCECHCSV